MLSYRLTSAVIGVALAVIILWLVRRDRLHGPYAVWWVGAAGAVALFGSFPQVFDLLAPGLGISYPPVLALLLALALLLIKILTMDLERSRQERQIRRLTQRMAMLEVQTPLLRADRNPSAEGRDTEGDDTRSESGM
jgi:hypothetical protein